MILMPYFRASQIILANVSPVGGTIIAFPPYLFLRTLIASPAAVATVMMIVITLSALSIVFRVFGLTCFLISSLYTFIMENVTEKNENIYSTSKGL